MCETFWPSQTPCSGRGRCLEEVCVCKTHWGPATDFFHTNQANCVVFEPLQLSLNLFLFIFSLLMMLGCGFYLRKTLTQYCSVSWHLQYQTSYLQIHSFLGCLAMCVVGGLGFFHHQNIAQHWPKTLCFWWAVIHNALTWHKVFTLFFDMIHSVILPPEIPKHHLKMMSLVMSGLYFFYACLCILNSFIIHYTSLSTGYVAVRLFYAFLTLITCFLPFHFHCLCGPIIGHLKNYLHQKPDQQLILALSRLQLIQQNLWLMFSGIPLYLSLTSWTWLLVHSSPISLSLLCCLPFMNFVAASMFCRGSSNEKTSNTSKISSLQTLNTSIHNLNPTSLNPIPSP